MNLQHVKKPVLASAILAIGSLLSLVNYCNTGQLTLAIVSVLAIALSVGTSLWFLRKVKAENLKTSQSLDQDIRSLVFDNGKSNALGLDSLKKMLEQTTAFIHDIGEGSYHTQLPGLDSSNQHLNKTNLTGELLLMKAKMERVAEEEKERTWTANGLAHFSEVVRASNKNLEKISIQFIGELVQYIKANQGGIFIAKGSENEVVLELKGCYAYGKRKFINRKIAPGEGLVGQAFLEGDVILLTDIPTNYISITSGLGEALPRCVVLIPMKTRDRIEGVIELASFQIWRKHEIEFLKKVAEILGSAINHARVAENTQRLLEESNHQAEQLRSQEEELRQNLEELNATQEAMERKSREAIAQSLRLNAILDSTADTIITLTPHGVLESINRAGVTLFGYTEKELIGKPIDSIIRAAMPEENGVVITLLETVAINGKTKYEGIRKDRSVFPAEFSVTDSNDGIKQFLTVIVRDISERVKAEHDQLQYIEELRAQEEELRQNMEELEATQEEIHRQFQEINKINGELDARVDALNVSTIMSESDLFGTINFVNDKFVEVSQYSREELIGKPHNLLRHPDMPAEVFRLMWQTIKSGQIFRGIVKNRKKDGTHYWVDAVIAPVKDEDGKPLKYIGVRYVIEDEELANKLFREQLQRLNLLSRAA